MRCKGLIFDNSGEKPKLCYLDFRLGENLKRLNTAGLALAKMKLEVGEIAKVEFMGMVKRAAANIQMAKKCFEDTQLVDK